MTKEEMQEDLDSLQYELEREHLMEPYLRDELIRERDRLEEELNNLNINDHE